ncbi:unnamed protein product [Effrenium voratum]|nr:unnamed protein product [Effrenium voratum]
MEREGKVMQLLAEAGLAHQQELDAVKQELQNEMAILLAELDDLKGWNQRGRTPKQTNRRSRKAGTFGTDWRFRLCSVFGNEALNV